jgi:hypothetical protein
MQRIEKSNGGHVAIGMEAKYEIRLRKFLAFE